MSGHSSAAVLAARANCRQTRLNCQRLGVAYFHTFAAKGASHPESVAATAAFQEAKEANRQAEAQLVAAYIAEKAQP